MKRKKKLSPSSFLELLLIIYRAGYAAHPLRHAFLPAIVSTSGRIHGELLRLLFNLADKKTSNYFVALGEVHEAFDVGRPRSRPRAAARPRT